MFEPAGTAFGVSHVPGVPDGRNSRWVITPVVAAVKPSGTTGAAASKTEEMWVAFATAEMHMTLMTKKKLLNKVSDLIFLYSLLVKKVVQNEPPSSFGQTRVKNKKANC